MGEIRNDYAHIVPRLKEAARSEPAHITPDQIFRPANLAARNVVNEVVDDLLLPESDILGFQHLEELAERARSGAATLILMEHYSNFDIPCFYRLLDRRGQKGQEIADRILSMAGVKLTEETEFVRAFSSAYPRIMIYPSRALQGITDEARYRELCRRSAVINMKALREMVRRKNEGWIVLVFPAGTRYRPGKPETRRPLPEVAGYLKNFDYVAFIGTGGNVLRVSPTSDMTRDITAQDIIVHSVGQVQNADDLRNEVKARARRRDGTVDTETLREKTATYITEQLDQLHREAREYRLPLLEKRGISDWETENVP